MLSVRGGDFMFKDTKAFSSFSVKDLQKAKEFYGKTLGLNIEEIPEGLNVHINGVELFIYPKENHTPATFSVLNFLVDDVDKAVDELVKVGVKLEQIDMGQGMKTNEKGVMKGEGDHPGPKAMAWFKDPAGNFLSVIQEK